ncbi:hypothetical protein [Litoreibacter roseus]|uniref:Uncharacterized protein n=1 Tax=Litoreibacter roseus TaxID=2601869 RepID=A0A6N6JKA0_9RHOB|nr:hypothetical protein [Litoreibacter roseus]GFE66736.1 hypothetical protein KIN_38100 [Litoreibacter roseus]
MTGPSRRVGTPLFLERGVYRRRRLIDAAKLLPFLAMALFLIPAWLSSGNDGAPGQTSAHLIYFFAAWLLLIAVALWLSHALHRSEGADTSEEDTPPVGPAE